MPANRKLGFYSIPRSRYKLVSVAAESCSMLSAQILSPMRLHAYRFLFYPGKTPVMKFTKYAQKCWMLIYYAWLRIRLSLAPGHHRRQAIRLPPVEGRIPARPDTPLLFFAAADHRYFDKYGRSFIGSLLAHQRVPSVHIHLFNPQAKQLEYLQQLATSAPDLRLSYSWEHADLQPLPTPRRGRYYYSMRFVRMDQLMRQTGADCLCLDIDTLLVKPAEELMSALRDCDIAFYPRFGRFGIDTKLLAGTLFLRYAPLSVQLLSRIADKISRFIRGGQVLNKLDQIVIYDEFKRFSKRESGLRFKPLDESVIDTGFTDSGIIWYPKGQSKNDALYEEKRRRYSTLTPNIPS